MKKLAAISLLLLFFLPTAAQKTNSTALSRTIDEIVKKELTQPAAGISIAVARDGKLIFSKGYGMANLEHSVPVAPETVFHIDSISKNILAAVVLKLVEQGKLSLDDDIRKYVPDAPVNGKLVTIRQLLSHTSGIYSFTSLPNASDNERLDFSHKQVLALVKDKPFDFEPGTRWRYDNTGFFLAGMAVESVTKQDYAAYLRENVFKPLGMNATSLCDARMIVPHLASGYETEKDSLVNAEFLSWKLPWAAGAVCATAEDLVKWQSALENGAFISRQSLELMRAPTRLSDGTMVDYGLGTRRGSLDGHTFFGHTGSGGGFRNVIEAFPADHLIIAVLINADRPPPLEIAADIVRAVLGLPKKALLGLPVPENELQALSKKWDSDDGPVEIFAADGKLHYRILGTPVTGVLRRQAENIYAINDRVEVRFLVRNGQAMYSFVYNNGIFADAKYVIP
jgi:CubicO group peptidase (beta-lactamase class C family)